MAKSKVASPGHKLGQTVGVVLQNVLKGPLTDFAARNGLYCDSQGNRPGVRPGKKVTWNDLRGNQHDLDYVLERGGTATDRGKPVAFIEIAWRRYTKHSRNKSGELEGALLPLAVAYPSVRFLGVVLAGEYSGGGIQQLRSAGIELLAIPFETIKAAFASQGIRIDYPEKAGAKEKAMLNRALGSLTPRKLEKISRPIWNAIKNEFAGFESRLSALVNISTCRVRIITLFGFEQEYTSIEAAIQALSTEDGTLKPQAGETQGYEAFVNFASGSSITGRFKTKDELLRFLRQVA